MTQPPDDWTSPGTPAGWGSPPPGPGWGPPAGGVQPAQAVRPGVIPLRPLSLGEVLDGAFGVVRRNPRATLGWSAVILLVTNLVTLGVTVLDGSLADGLDAVSGGSGTFGGGGSVLGQVLSIFVGAIAAVVLTGYLSAVVAEAVLGRRTSFAAAGRRVRPQLGALVGAAVVAGCAPVIALVAFVVPGIFLWGALALTAPAVVLEGLPPGAALRRSWRLAVPDFWRVWGTRALAWLIVLAIGVALVLPVGVVGAVTSSGLEDVSLAALIAVAVVSLLTSIVTEPFLAAVVALLYVDRRMRAEALDLTLAAVARDAGGTTPTLPL